MTGYHESPETSTLRPFTAEEVAALLEVDVQGVWRACRLRQLPGAFKLGSRWYVARPALLRLLHEGAAQVAQEDEGSR